MTCSTWSCSLTAGSGPLKPGSRGCRVEVVNVLFVVCLSNLALTIIIAQKMLHLENEVTRMGSLNPDATQIIPTRKRLSERTTQNIKIMKRGR